MVINQGLAKTSLIHLINFHFHSNDEMSIHQDQQSLLSYLKIINLSLKHQSFESFSGQSFAVYYFASFSKILVRFHTFNLLLKKLLSCNLENQMSIAFHSLSLSDSHALFILSSQILIREDLMCDLTQISIRLGSSVQLLPFFHL